ncbi:MAG TPA: DinB family protein [Thermoanaerobaculia bacterium]|nr:DinB family protein [Thermoanaerobaculia bacterium]
MTLNASERSDLIRRYEDGPANLRAAWDRVPPEARKWRPAEGQWSAHEVVCHAADSESNAYVRIRFLAADPNPTIFGYDQERWAKNLDYHAASPDLALQTVDAVRANTADLLKRLPESTWSAAGTHTESGRYTGENWLRVYAEHLEKHTRQIERNLEAWKARQA